MYKQPRGVAKSLIGQRSKMEISTNRKRKRDIQEIEFDTDSSFTVQGCGFSAGVNLKKRRKSLPGVRIVKEVSIYPEVKILFRCQ